MNKVGIIGWRGMVGSVLKERMLTEGDFKLIEPYFFSTSQVGAPTPKIEDIKEASSTLLDAFNLDQLKEMDIILTTQGGGYTEKIHPTLKDTGWKGYWIDAASTLRMTDDSIIVFDPVNLQLIKDGITNGVKDYIGGNCTASIMLMSIGGLLLRDEVEWVSSMTYQAASGAGAKAMGELLAQMGQLTDLERSLTGQDILTVEKQLTAKMNQPNFPTETIGYPLIGGLLPWIDKEMNNPWGQSKEEWKGMAEVNKVLGRTTNPIPVDGSCVRIGSMRCHSMGFTIKLKRDLEIKTIEEMIASVGEWAKVIPNEKDITLKELTPAKVSGSLTIPVGRIRKMNLGKEYLNAFTVGDQLLWGAAEPLRRVLKIILNN